ncbi:unnamed protein product [Dovyalis caffra]|uniref:Proopiomelanocortin n=1 Tax=Dovyalis caffra TaxID=77055 RepID=A0AAV1RGN8_9ROSI|nr:unnamed protein product [Dovyalis caffra]
MEKRGYVASKEEVSSSKHEEGRGDTRVSPHKLLHKQFFNSREQMEASDSAMEGEERKIVTSLVL